MKKTKNKCWQCKKPTPNFRCNECAKLKSAPAYSTRPNFHRVIEKNVKVKDLIQPFNKDGSRNYDFQSFYGEKFYEHPI